MAYPSQHFVQLTHLQSLPLELQYAGPDLEASISETRICTERSNIQSVLGLS